MRIVNYLSTNAGKIVLLFSLCVSIASIIYYQNNYGLVNFGDAASRLNISRKLFDNLTPGLAQLGNLWLPLPQLLMMPFTYFDTLWHSGLAGSIVSGASFILLSWSVFMTVRLLTKSNLCGLLSVLVLFTNGNLLYMQTAAMSEVLFISCVSVAIYFLIRWSISARVFDLLFSAIFVSLSTLVRYEAYLFCIACLFYVAFIAYYKTRQRSKVEGKVILFGTLAFTGMVAWSLYLWTIFGNPFYWKDIYSRQASIISTDTVSRRTTIDATTNVQQKHSLWLSISSYWVSIAHMNGNIVSVLSTLALGVLGLSLIFKRTDKLWVSEVGLLLPLSIFAFVIFTLYNGGIPVYQPALNILGLESGRSASMADEYNIRYGLNMVPMLAVMVGWFCSKHKVILVLVTMLILTQTILVYKFDRFLIYQLPVKYQNSNLGMSIDQSTAVSWLKSNYSGGLIMISALKHDPAMFAMMIPYKRFIHEGTGKYWLTSRDNPQTYATWIFMYKPKYDIGTDEDSVTKYVANNPVLLERYSKTYENNTIEIYKIVGSPEKTINN